MTAFQIVMMACIALAACAFLWFAAKAIFEAVGSRKRARQRALVERERFENWLRYVDEVNRAMHERDAMDAQFLAEGNALFAEFLYEEDAQWPPAQLAGAEAARAPAAEINRLPPLDAQGPAPIRDAFEAFIEAAVEEFGEPPDRNCSCHISPPCSDCVDHSFWRDALADARAALAKRGGA